MADTAAGILDAQSIPASSTIRFTNVGGAGYDIVITTSSLDYSTAGNMGDPSNVNISWSIQGATASSLGAAIPYSSVDVHFYATGTSDPFYLTGVDFRLVDAETGERFRNLNYYSAHGDLVPLATPADLTGAANPILSYSHGTPVTYPDLSLDSGEGNVGQTQTTKWIEFNLSGKAVSGFSFQAGRASSGAGGVEISSLGDLVHQLQAIGSGAIVATGQSYDGLASTSTVPGGAGTQVQLLGGRASATTTVTAAFSLVSTSGFQAGAGTLSDVVSLQGTNGDKVVLQLSYDPAALAPGQLESDVFLGWFNGGGVLVNAVDGNTNLPGEVNNPLFHLGAYDPTLDFHLGYYGVDTVNKTAWAVIDHNSEFLAVPEPASAGLVALGALTLLARRRRRR
ncbi:MAG: PEP-CTERM sorting domain-containing protein [Chthoniobacter sp.]|uniref:PEP-CTERM sorting domain-containing protein n=1 Tax=Chthoniobacter sp. TaxID=2510640 RepID=UPI0032A57869